MRMIKKMGVIFLLALILVPAGVMAAGFMGKAGIMEMPGVGIE